MKERRLNNFLKMKNNRCYKKLINLFQIVFCIILIIVGITNVMLVMNKIDNIVVDQHNMKNIIINKKN